MAESADVIVTGHQPNYLPYPGFFEKIARAELFVVVDNVQYVKRGPFGWIHRNRIKTPGVGEGWDWLSVPVLSKGKFTQTIRETKINNSEPWARKHWKTIAWHYKKASFFAQYEAEIRGIYDRKWDWLWELNVEFIRFFLRVLEIQTPVKIATDLGISGESTDYVVDICRKTGGTEYLSGMHGRDYLEAAKFEAEGIKLRFQEYTAQPYPQRPPEPFVPHLSTLDLLLNCGPKARQIVLDGAGAY